MENVENTEHIGTFQKRNVDAKRRILLPKTLLANTQVFVLVQETPKEVRLYSYNKWSLYIRIVGEVKKLELEKTRKMFRLDKVNRMVLPKEMNWKKVDLTGMLDYIAITESKTE
ncbi:MAG: hypothetical protein WC010_03905 [Candidatus Absconditabacterales bacterium]